MSTSGNGTRAFMTTGRDIGEFAQQTHPDLLICLELHPGTVAYNVETFERLATLSPAIAANIDPSHFFWMGMDANKVVQRLGARIGHAHGKDVVFQPDKLALNGLLDRRWPMPPEEMPWNFATVGHGHDAAWWRRLLRDLRDAGRVRTISIEHEDPFVAPEIGIREAARLLAAALKAPRTARAHRMTQVRAAVTERPGRIALQQFPLPEPEPGAVLMKVHYSGICGTDKHTFRGESKQYAGTPHERDLTYPLICGHENVGEVVAIGGNVLDSEGRALKVGDRIVPGANVACGDCHFCRNGYPYYMCERMEDYGNSLHCGPAPHLFGGWAEYMYLLPRTPIFRVPDDLPDSVAVLTEIMAVTHGVETAQILARSDRRLSFRQFGRRAGRRPARSVPSDQGAAARRQPS